MRAITAPATASELVDRLLLEGVAAHPAVIKARKARAAVDAELRHVRQRRADLLTEHADLHDVAVRSDRNSAREMAARAVAIEKELQDLAAEERVLNVQKAGANDDVNAAADQARAEELKALKASAREIVARMIPIVEALSVLNDEYKAIVTRAGYHSSWPIAFGTASPATAKNWLTKARDFMSTDVR